jgi:peptidoglycan/xylan/chitin deacetylase (PgdA/CDA1 family)
MYHRVIPRVEVRDYIQAGMYVVLETFEDHLKFFKKYFSVVPVRQLTCGSLSAKYMPKGKLPCVVTFDDGWYDFYKYAYPLLKAYQIPATVFLPTDFIGTNKWFWTDRLAYVLSQKWHSGGLITPQQLLLNSPLHQLANFKGPFESLLEEAISTLKAYRNSEIEKIISDLAARWSVNNKLPDRAFMKWDEIREMKRSGLVSFGSHTVGHKILTTLTDDEINIELIESKKRLINEQAVDPSFIPFCYPNGNYNERIAKLVKDAGYSLAVTTKSGWNTFESNPFELKRIPVHQDMTATDAMFGCRIAGIF